MLRLWPWKCGRGRRRHLHPMWHALSAEGDDQGHIWTGVDERSLLRDAGKDDCLKVKGQLMDLPCEFARVVAGSFPPNIGSAHSTVHIDLVEATNTGLVLGRLRKEISL